MTAGSCPRVRLFPVPAALLLILIIRPADPAHAQTAPLRPTRLDCVFSGSLFGQASRADAIPAVRMWGSMVGKSKGFQVDPTVDVIDELAAIRRRVLAGSVTLLAVDVFEYIQLADIPVLEPIFCASRTQRGVPSRYVLVVRDEPETSSLENLRGKKVITHANTRADLGRVWLESLLQDGRLANPERFFASLDAVAKPSLAVLPVFFGKADAAVLDESSYELAREMNPQLGKKLRILRTSPLVVEGIVCFASRQIEFRNELREAVRDLHKDVQGKQILTIFRFGDMLPVDGAALASVRELWRKHLAWPRSVGGTAAADVSKPEARVSGNGGGQ